MTYIPRIAIGPTRSGPAHIDAIMRARKAQGRDEGIVPTEGYCSSRKVGL